MQVAMTDERFDVVVIGAGVAGIAAAKCYLDLHPKCRLAILDRDSCPGGTWNSRRLYDTFWSQIGLGMAEFSDMPMDRPPEDQIKDEFMEAKHVTNYLERYLEDHVFANRSMKDRLVLGFNVTNARKQNGVWLVSGSQVQQKERTFVCHKLVVGMGLTSEPRIPSFPNRDQFRGFIVHQKEFGSSGILSSPDIKHVVVIGGAKSAADMVYASIKAGKEVIWLIRKSGSGPAAFVPGKGKGTYKNSAELGATRILGIMTPSIFEADSWLSWFMNRTLLGRWFANLFWAAPKKISNAIFESGLEARPGFQDLKSTVDVFWANDSLGLIQLEDFWPEVAKHAQVFRADIEGLGEHSIRLSNGVVVDADAILCGTGWLKVHDIFDIDTARELGVPHRLTQADPADIQLWNELENIQEKKVVDRFPKLANPPKTVRKPMESTPFRLYNLIAPIEDRADRSIALIGYIQVPSSFRPAEIQAMWATAYLDGKVNLPSRDEMREKVASVVAWNRRRYLNNGATGTYLHYDMLAYTDKLLADLGITGHLSSSTWNNLTAPCFPRDLGPAKIEFQSKFGTTEEQGALPVG